ILPEHILASSALTPDFAPIDVGGRLLVDGGFTGNLALDAVAADPAWSGYCIAFDLFTASAPPPKDLASAMVRRHELIFASQSRWLVEACRSRLAGEGDASGSASRAAGLALLSYSAQCEFGCSLY